MRLNVKALATASAMAGMLLYAVGALIDRFSAWGGAAVVSYVFRVDIVQLAMPLTLGSFIMGAVTFALLFAAVAAVVGWTYNLLAHPTTVAAPSAATSRGR